MTTSEQFELQELLKEELARRALDYRGTFMRKDGVFFIRDSDGIIWGKYKGPKKVQSTWFYAILPEGESLNIYDLRIIKERRIANELIRQIKQPN